MKFSFSKSAAVTVGAAADFESLCLLDAVFLTLSAMLLPLNSPAVFSAFLIG